MTDQELRDILRAELAPIRAELAPIRAELAALKEQTHDIPRIRALADGIPIINRALITLQQETRSLRAAFNDFARTNVTAGEVEALHTDVNRAQADYMELATRLATVERRLDALEKH